MTGTETPSADRDLVRGRLDKGIVEFLKQIREQTNLVGFLISVGALFFGVYFILGTVAGRAESALGQGTVEFVALLVALSYTTWVGWSVHREYNELDRARAISRRPSIGTVVEAFGLLTSTDSEAREFASAAVTEIVSLGPEKVVNQTGVDSEELVTYLIPLLDDPSSNTRSNIAVAVRLFARDYPESVSPHRDILLEAVRDEYRDGGVRSELALSVGYLVLSTDMDTNQIEPTALELLESSEPQLRIGACYMLAGDGSATARRKLKEIAGQDPDPEVRAHAEALV